MREAHPPVLSPRALVRADGSPTIGLGHVGRMLVLGSELRRRGWTVVFAVQEACEVAVRTIAARGFEVERVAAVAGSEEDAARTRAVASRRGAALLVVDGYAFGAGYLRAVRTAEALRLCGVDDLFGPVAGCDAVLNGNLFADASGYEPPLAPRMLLGPRYALVRETFLAARRAPRGAPVERLLVTFGGSDATRQTMKALAALRLLGPGEPPLRVRVVTGGANAPAFVRELEDEAQRCQPHAIEVRRAVDDMASEMAWADAAVTAAGTTCLELSCVGVPAITIAVADNQRRVADACGSLGLMRSLGWHDDVSAESLARALVDLRHDTPARVAMVEAQHMHVDGRGAERVAEALTELVG